jgi:hypothetical protein
MIKKTQPSKSSFFPPYLPLSTKIRISLIFSRPSNV